jgi:hypothetical protein
MGNIREIYRISDYQKYCTAVSAFAIIIIIPYLYYMNFLAMLQIIDLS